MKRAIKPPSPALVVAVIALVAATTGAAVALPGKNSVKSDDIARGAVTKKAIKKGAVTKKAIKKGAVTQKAVKKGAVKTAALANGAVTRQKLGGNSVNGAKVEDGSLGAADLGDYDTFNERVEATDGATYAAARDAAPEVPLAEFGSMRLYAKCLHDTTNDDTLGEIYVETSVDGAVVQGYWNYPDGGGLLMTTTPETDRVLDQEEETGANSGFISEAESVLITPEGRYAHVLTSIAIKQGDLGGGTNGPFGDGNVCLFGGVLNG